MTIKNSRNSKKKTYRKPGLKYFGDVRVLTQAGRTGSMENSGSMMAFMASSDRRLKENLVRIGQHPLGLALYLFNYRVGFRDSCGHGTYLGVIADEVAMRWPEAVAEDERGYLKVDYAYLDRMAAASLTL